MEKYKEARKRAVKTYMESKDVIKIILPKGEKDIWKKAAEKNEISLNKFVIECVEKYIK